MQGLLVALCLQLVTDSVSAVLVVLRRQAADLPAGRERDGHVIQLFKRKIEVNRKYAVAVVEYPLFRGTENPDRQKHSPPGARAPSGNLQVILGNQRRG